MIPPHHPIGHVVGCGGKRARLCQPHYSHILFFSDAVLNYTNVLWRMVSFKKLIGWKSGQDDTFTGPTSPDFLDFFSSQTYLSRRTFHPLLDPSCVQPSPTYINTLHNHCMISNIEYGSVRILLETSFQVFSFTVMSLYMREFTCQMQGKYRTASTSFSSSMGLNLETVGTCTR